MESVKLTRLVFNRLFEVCCLWLKELPFHRRPMPYYETSIHAIKNMRRKMEDKHVIIPDFNTLFKIQVGQTSNEYFQYDSKMSSQHYNIGCKCAEGL